MPIPRNNRIKQWMDKSEECKARLIENYEIKEKSNNNSKTSTGKH